MAVEKKLQQDKTDDFIRIQDLFYLCLAKWYWFVISLVVTMGVAAIYLLKTPQVFTRSAMILIKDESQGKSMSSDIGFSELGLFQSNTNVNNELVALQSPSVMTEVVRRLHLDMNYSIDGRFHKKVVYGTTLPVNVTISGLSDSESASFTLQLHADGTYTLTQFARNGEMLHSGESELSGKLGAALSTPVGEVTVMPSVQYTTGIDSKIYVQRVPLYATVNRYSSQFSASLEDEKSTVIRLTINDVSTQRAEDVLNTIISVYNENWVKDKNQIAVSTSMFIDDRLAIIEKELGTVDEDISSYKSEHLLPDVQSASSMYMSQSSEINDKLLALNNQLYMTRYIRNYLTNDANVNALLPANSGVESSGIESQIAEYNTQLLQRNSLVASSSESNPLVVDLDKALASMRKAIITSIDNQLVTIETQINTLQQSEKQTTERIAANPDQAKYLLSVERQQKVKESLYLFLLQKREENELSQAFTAYNTRIITPPISPMYPTSPVKKNIFLVALALGILIPVVIIFIRENMNTKIRGRKDLESLSLPLIGEIPLSVSHDGKSRGFLKRIFSTNNTRQKKGQRTALQLFTVNWNRGAKSKIEEAPHLVVKDGRRDVVNEAFRVLRTNLEFIVPQDRQSNIIVVTSFNPGSGKTFLTLNIAESLAIKGKKVLVIDGDLRRASTSSFIGSPKLGLSNYLAKYTDNIDDIIVTDKDKSSFSILPVGVIPPNPTELLEEKRFSDLIDKVRPKYDYIFIDCPPVEIVADTAIIEKLADRTLFVVRASLLERSMLPVLETMYEEHKLKNMSLILNGTQDSGSRYGYKYAYHYGYESKNYYD